MPGGSPVTQAAIARLGVQVALPSRGDIARGLNWLPGVISGVFKQVNQKKLAVLQQDLSTSKDALHQLVGTEQNIRASRDAAIRSQEKASLGESLKAYKKSIGDGQSMLQKALEAPSTGNASKNFMASQKGWMNVTGRISKRFDALFKKNLSGYELMRESAREFYKLDAEDRKLMLTGLKNELISRQDNLKALKDEAAMLKTAAAKDPGGMTIGRDGLPQSYDERKLALDEELQKAGQAADYAGQRLKFFGETLNKNKEGTAAYNKEVKTTKERVMALTDKLAKIHGGYDRLGILVAQKVTNAFQGFRSILQQSIITLTLFYYKINQVVDSFMQFEKELMNAQSIFQTTNETLYTLSNQIVRFGTEFGISYDNAAKGLYQFASAGLSAEDSIKVLNDTLKLSMAVQGDHNTISKLTTQVLFGFGLGMDQATEVTDKFAHAINKSLIEYQDLASAIKFSMPFFVSSGQSLDTLLGALQVLTNRALEAGIAGRGLRQALAEFTQHADDNSAAFRQLGVEILDTEGNMFDLTHIAHQFNEALGEQASDMEVMMTLMDDLNIRGATAFIHLVQNADEFSAAVNDLKNSSGAAHEMAMIQQESLFNQIQILKNALLAPFLMADPAAVARGEMNLFGEAVHKVVQQLKDLFIVETDNGQALSKLGFQIREIAIKGIGAFADATEHAITVLTEWTEQGFLNMNMIKLYFLPLTVLIKLIDAVPVGIGKLLVTMFILNKTLALGQIINAAWTLSLISAGVTGEIVAITWAKSAVEIAYANYAISISFSSIAASISAALLGLTAFYYLGRWIGDSMGPVIAILLGLAIAVAAVQSAFTMGAGGAIIVASWKAIGATAAGLGMIIGGIASYAMPDTDPVDMSGYEAQLSGNYSLNGSGGSGTPQTLNVQNLNYNDSNWSEYANNQMQSQAGSNRYERKVSQ